MTRICFHNTVTIVTGTTGTFLVEATASGYTLSRWQAPERWTPITAAPVRDALITRACQMAEGEA
jgi:hypothetical protein